MSGAPEDAPPGLREQLRREGVLDEAAEDQEDTTDEQTGGGGDAGTGSSQTSDAATDSTATADSAAPTDDEIPEGVDPAGPSGDDRPTADADAGDTEPAPGRERPPEGTNPAGPTGGPGRTAPDQDSQQRGGDSRQQRRQQGGGGGAGGGGQQRQQDTESGQQQGGGTTDGQQAGGGAEGGAVVATGDELLPEGEGRNPAQGLEVLPRRRGVSDPSELSTEDRRRFEAAQELEQRLLRRQSLDDPRQVAIRDRPGGGLEAELTPAGVREVARFNLSLAPDARIAERAAAGLAGVGPEDLRVEDPPNAPAEVILTRAGGADLLEERAPKLRDLAARDVRLSRTPGGVDIDLTEQAEARTFSRLRRDQGDPPGAPPADLAAQLDRENVLPGGGTTPAETGAARTRAGLQASLAAGLTREVRDALAAPEFDLPASRREIPGGALFPFEGDRDDQRRDQATVTRRQRPAAGVAADATAGGGVGDRGTAGDPGELDDRTLGRFPESIDLTGLPNIERILDSFDPTELRDESVTAADARARRAAAVTAERPGVGPVEALAGPLAVLTGARDESVTAGEARERRGDALTAGPGLPFDLPERGQQFDADAADAARERRADALTAGAGLPVAVTGQAFEPGATARARARRAAAVTDGPGFPFDLPATGQQFGDGAAGAARERRADALTGGQGVPFTVRERTFSSGAAADARQRRADALTAAEGELALSVDGQAFPGGAADAARERRAAAVTDGPGLPFDLPTEGQAFPSGATAAARARRADAATPADSSLSLPQRGQEFNEGAVAAARERRAGQATLDTDPQVPAEIQVPEALAGRRPEEVLEDIQQAGTEAGGQAGATVGGAVAGPVGRRFGRGVGEGSVGLLAGAPLLLGKEVPEFVAATGEAVAEGRGEEFAGEVAEAGERRLLRTVEFAERNPAQFAGQVAGSLVLSAGALRAARAAGTPRVATAVDVGIQPGEFAARALASRGVLNTRLATAIPGVRRGQPGLTGGGPAGVTVARNALRFEEETESELAQDIQAALRRFEDRGGPGPEFAGRRTRDPADPVARRLSGPSEVRRSRERLSKRERGDITELVQETDLSPSDLTGLDVDQALLRFRRGEPVRPEQRDLGALAAVDPEAAATAALEIEPETLAEVGVGELTGTRSLPRSDTGGDAGGRAGAEGATAETDTFTVEETDVETGAGGEVTTDTREVPRTTETETPGEVQPDTESDLAGDVFAFTTGIRTDALGELGLRGRADRLGVERDLGRDTRSRARERFGFSLDVITEFGAETSPEVAAEVTAEQKTGTEGDILERLGSPGGETRGNVDSEPQRPRDSGERAPAAGDDLTDQLLAPGWLAETLTTAAIPTAGIGTQQQARGSPGQDILEAVRGGTPSGGGLPTAGFFTPGVSEEIAEVRDLFGVEEGSG